MLGTLCVQSRPYEALMQQPAQVCGLQFKMCRLASAPCRVLTATHS